MGKGGAIAERQGGVAAGMLRSFHPVYCRRELSGSGFESSKIHWSAACSQATHISVTFGLPACCCKEESAAIYVITFIAVLRQFKPLLGERGLLPVPDFLEGHSFREVPSIFCWRYSDRLLVVVAWTGLLVAICALCGVTEAGSVWISVGAGLLLWFFYLSIVNVGQQFSASAGSRCAGGWLLHGFLRANADSGSILPVLMLHWMLFEPRWARPLSNCATIRAGGN